MADEEKKAPELRFKGFLDDWEQRKLGEFADISTGKLDANAMVEDGEYDFYTSGMKKYRIDTPAFEGPAITIAGNGATVGYMHLADGEFNAYQRTYVLQNFQANRYFLYSEISKKLPRKIAQEARTGNIPYIVMDMLTELTISLPVLEEEQSKIGAFFKQLDNTIALHQRMSDKQKNLKANLLQMMFPRNGEKIPEVRLAGFVEDWSQRTLEDISDKVTEKNKAREFTETLTNSAEYGIISQSDYFDKDISNINNINGYYVVRPDDFVYNPRISNFAPVGPIKRNNLNRIGIMSPLYYVFRPKRVDHTFLEKYFETSYWHIFMKMNGDSGARADRFAIKDTILKEMPIPYPIMEEQVKIGIFFNQLDKSIVLHQEKIAHLKILKSTLLNKMFI